MKTNFEKWKEDLKPEELLSARPVDGTKCVWINCNTNCPALNCPANCVGKGLDVYKWHRYAQKCEHWFLQWANAPAKEDDK